MKQKYLLLTMIILIFLFSATSLSVLAVTPNLELTPASQSVTVGNQANINVVVEEVTNLRGANIILDFDASKLQYVSSADGGFIPSATLLEQSIDNTNGSVTLDIAGLGVSAYASGTGTIMTVIFNRIATGDTNITFGSTTLRDKDNITITHTKSSGCLMTSLLGDFNADGCVEFEDLMIFAMAYGSCEGDANWNPVCDLNSDGCIEFEDLMLFAMHYGTTEPTRIIRLESDLNFGSVQVGQSSQRTLIIYNDGNSTLTVYGIDYPTGFSGDWSGPISAGGYHSVTVTFLPTQPITYSGTLTVNSDKTGGINTKSVTGNGGCTSPPVSEVSALAYTYHSSMSKIQSKINKLIEENKLHRSYPLVEPKRTTKGDVVYEIYIEWAEYTGADGYKIYRSVNGGSYTLIAEGNVDPGYDYYSFWDSSVTAGNTYSYYVTAYYVTAYGTGWETCPSQSASTTPLPPCSLISPSNGATINNPAPAFFWSPVGVSSYPYGAIYSGESDLYVYDETAGSTSWWTYFTNMTTSSATYNQDGQATALVSGHSYTWNSWAYGYDGSGKGIAVSVSEDWGFDYGGSTRIIRLEGDLNFGDVQVGQSSQRTLTIYNDGNSTLTVTNIDYPTGFSGDWSGDIPDGGHHDVTVTFAPTQAIAYNGTLTVNSNKTAGTNTKLVSGTGTEIPTVTTQAATDIETNSVTANGTITSDGGSKIIEKGFEYGLTQTPTWSVKETGTDLGTGAFSNTISGLDSDTTYWVKAYAVNNEDKSVNEDWQEFHTPPDIIITNEATFTCDGQQAVMSDCNITLQY